MSWNFSKIDEINAMSSQSLQDHKGETVTVTGMTVAQRPNEDGEVTDIMLFKTKEHGVMSTISGAVLRIADDILEYCEENKLTEISMQINSGKSKNDREFITVSFQ